MASSPEPSAAAELVHDARACEFAHQRLTSSPNHRAIEVWREGTKLHQAAAD